jgi:hypothetical protein
MVWSLSTPGKVLHLASFCLPPRGVRQVLRGLDRMVNNGIAFIAAVGKESTSVRTQDIGVGGVPVLNGRSLQCQYTSLSDRTYWTVVDFDHASGNIVESTRFRGER